MYWTRLNSTQFDQDKTRPNTIQIIPFGFYLAGQNPDLMMMENDAGTTTTTTTMERGKVVFLLSSSEPKINLRGRKKKPKRHFLLDFQKKCLPTPKCIPSVVQSLTPPASQPLSLSFFCARCISEKIATSSPLFTTIINIDPSIKPKGRRREEVEGRKRKEEEGASPTYLPA